MSSSGLIWPMRSHQGIHNIALHVEMGIGPNMMEISILLRNYLTLFTFILTFSQSSIGMNNLHSKCQVLLRIFYVGNFKLNF